MFLINISHFFVLRASNHARVDWKRGWNWLDQLFFPQKLFYTQQMMRVLVATNHLLPEGHVTHFISLFLSFPLLFFVCLLHCHIDDIKIRSDNKRAWASYGEFVEKFPASSPLVFALHRGVSRWVHRFEESWCRGDAKHSRSLQWWEHWAFFSTCHEVW